MKRFISVFLVAVLLMCVPMTAFAAPNPQGLDTSIDYMHEMIRAANDGSPYALHAGAIFERLRNYKIDVLGWGNKYEKTNFFTNGCTQASVLQAIEEFRSPKPKYTDEEIDWITRVVSEEAGCDWMPDWVPEAVASVILNRVASNKFPNDIKSVIKQPGQYGPYITGSMWRREPTARVKRIVKATLEKGSVLPAGVLGQSGYPTGAVHKSYYDYVLGTTIYFFYV